MAYSEPMRGEVWYVELDPTKGHEQRGKRPALIVSANTFNRGAAELVVVLPMTSKGKGIPMHIEVIKPEGGVAKTSYVMPEMVRSISKERLGRRCGNVTAKTMHQVDDRLRILLDL